MKAKGESHAKSGQADRGSWEDRDRTGQDMGEESRDDSEIYRWVFSRNPWL